MGKEVKVAIVGLDTSHAVEFPMHFQAPDCPPALRVPGIRVERCLRFETPFQDARGLDERQRQLEAWGVRVTERFEDAVADCDAIMIEVNDPTLHEQYFARCAGLGKPIFLDKPLADTGASGERILAEARRHGTRFFSASTLRFVGGLVGACASLPAPRACTAYGPLGIAPAGSSIVWYGVHVFEMLERALGRGARRVFTRLTATGAVALVGYDDGRSGVVELVKGAPIYGGSLRTDAAAVHFTVDMDLIYVSLLREVSAFFQGGPSPVAGEDTREVMAMLDAAERSAHTGREEPTGL
jgi:hypothetical protein